MDKQKRQCVICHKDITNELPKIDIYGNHYCKDCYIEKCKYEIMNMRDTVLIHKGLLKKELQYLEEQTQKYTRKETAEKFAERVKNVISNEWTISSFVQERLFNEIDEICKEFTEGKE